MIFVTVGTHEQQFNRLIQYLDVLKKNEIINEEIIIQTGYSTYIPQHCVWKKFFEYQEIRKMVDKARIIITHGGPSSFIMPLQIGKIPIVVPRQSAYGEHVNDHQTAFTRKVYERMGIILLVEDLEDLENILRNYDFLIKNMDGKLKSNNNLFVEKFETIVNDIMGIK